MPTSIQQLPASKRPRERLAKLGPQNSTTSELLAIIIGSGTKKRSVLTQAKELTKAFGHRLNTVTFAEIQPVVGTVHATKIIAAIELGKRVSSQPSLRTIDKLNQVLQETEHFRKSHREHTVGLYLNARYELLEKVTLAVGTLNASVIEPRDVLAPALTLPCRSFILIHNHPSGNATPSEDDLKTTKRLQSAGELLGITMLDHVIVTAQGHFSFHEHKLLATLE